MNTLQVEGTKLVFIWKICFPQQGEIEQLVDQFQRNNKNKNKQICLNKRPMDHIAHLRYQFKSMSIFERNYDYIYITKLAQ